MLVGLKENLDHSRKRENIKFLFIFLLRFNLNGKQSETKTSSE